MTTQFKIHHFPFDFYRMIIEGYFYKNIQSFLQCSQGPLFSFDIHIILLRHFSSYYGYVTDHPKKISGLK